MRESVRRGYDELAGAYAASRTGNPATATLRAEFHERLPADARVLDAGCGPGRPVLADLAERVRAVGLDFSRTQLRLAVDNAPDAALAAGDMARLPFARDAFDGIVAFWSLIHVPRGAHPAVVAEFARVLRPGGHLLVLEGTGRWQGSNPDWLDSGVEMTWAMAGADATRAHCHRAGFTITDGWRVPEALDEPEAGGGPVRIPQPDRYPRQRDESVRNEGRGESDGGELPWTVFLARLDPE